MRDRQSRTTDRGMQRQAKADRDREKKRHRMKLRMETETQKARNKARGHRKTDIVKEHRESGITVKVYPRNFFQETT